MSDLVINTETFNNKTTQKKEQDNSVLEETNDIDLTNIQITNKKNEDKRNKKLTNYILAGTFLILGGITFSIINKQQPVGIPTEINNTEVVKVNKEQINIKVNKEKITELNIEVNEDKRKLTLVEPRSKNKVITTKIEKAKPLNRIHIVKSGDSLYEIGIKYDISYKKLMELNNKSNTRLSIGEKIYIDNPKNKKQKNKMVKVEKSKAKIVEIKKETLTTISSSKQKKDIKDLFKNTTVKPKENIKREYIVKKGDTLYNIAKKFNTTVKNIKISSNKQNNELKIGEKLIF